MPWTRLALGLGVMVAAISAATCSTFEAPACDDGERNGTETDVDCGGTCSGCQVGQSCGEGADCQTSVCGPQSTCVEAGCNDQAQNGDETGVDCGGGTCPACGVGEACVAAGDCASKVCKDAVCAEPTCDDKLQNGTETDVDCGGDCQVACANGKKCQAEVDCTSGFCSGDKTCADPTCGDKAQNGTETDVDCGGACTACELGKKCEQPADCKSETCEQEEGGDFVCVVNPCEDGKKNNLETDIDCGGALQGGACDPCDLNKACENSQDCKSNSCQNLVCKPASCNNGVQDGGETAPDCGGPCSRQPLPQDCIDQCNLCAQGLGCSVAEDCADPDPNDNMVPSCVSNVCTLVTQ